MKQILTILLLAADAVFLLLDCRAKYAHRKRPFKGWLMPVIMVIYFLNMRTFSLLQLLAMIGGWLGDLFLLKDEKPYFTAGCLSFMAGHIAYGVLYFTQIDLRAMPPALLLGALIYILYAALIYRRLRPSIPVDFRGYAVFYMIFITLMSFLALLRFHSVNTPSWLLTWIGSMCFMVSDTLVAFEKFEKPELRGVMETYVPAQVLLMFGSALY